MKLVRSNACVAEALKEMPAHSRILERMAAELEHRLRISSEHRTKTLLGGTGELAGVIEAAENVVFGFLVSSDLRIGQTVKAWDVTKTGTWQRPERFSTWVGTCNPGHKSMINYPPVATSGIGGPIETEICGLHAGNPLGKQLGVVISAMTTKIE